MGPFVPALISDELNLVVALVIGLAFGFVLEQAGFSSSRKLAGVFYGYDFTVLRVFFTAAITAMSGVMLLGYFGLLDTGAIYINPTWLWPAVVGGAIMGLGFVIGGYCPGTSVCAAAIGKVDAMLFVAGGFLGVLLFGELYPLYDGFYLSSALGPIFVFDSLGMSNNLFALMLIVVALSAFAITTLIERRVNSSAPSRAFNRSYHRIAFAGALALATLLAILPDRQASIMAEISDAGYATAHPVKTMTADELAFRIVDREPNLQIVDIRPAADFQQLSLPGSQNLAISDFFKRDSEAIFSRRHVKKAVVAASEAEARTACLLLSRLGYENVAAMEGGFANFKATILDSTAYVPVGNRWDNDVRSFRESARLEINRMIEAARNTVPQADKKTRKIAGGC